MRAARPVLRALPFLAIAAVGCVEPLQNGGVTIIGDPAQRLSVMCRFHQNDEAFCERDRPAAKGARTRRIAAKDDGLTGPFATGRAGDYVLENDDVTIVVGQPGDPKRAGAILDAADATTRADAIGEVRASLGDAENAAVYEAIVTGTGSEGAAYIEAQGHALATPAVRVTTRYELAPGARAVTITTTVLATGPDLIAGLDLGDTVTWGGTKSGAPEAAESAPATAAPTTTATATATAAPTTTATATEVPVTAPPADRAAPYLFGVGDGAGYALVKDGEPFSFRGDAATSIAIFERGVTLAPSKPLTYSRALVIATRADTLAIATELFFLAGGSPGGVEIGLAPPDAAHPIDRSDGRVILRRASGSVAPPLPDPPSLWLSQPEGAPAGGEIAPGKYTARFESPRASSAEIPFEITAGKVTRVILPVAPRER